MTINNILFHIKQLDLRGTCVAVYDYAFYNEKLLNNISFIAVRVPSSNEVDFYTNLSSRETTMYVDMLCAQSSATEDEKRQQQALIRVWQKFRLAFNKRLFIYQTREELDKICQTNSINIFYNIVYGTRHDSIEYMPSAHLSVKTLIHCVFDMSEPHGDLYVGVSETLALKYNRPGEFLSHMIGINPYCTKNNLRKWLNIPYNAIVFGRHGGRDTFDIQFVKDMIIEIVNENKNIYFIFVNTPAFTLNTHKQIIYLDTLVSEVEKCEFINTCDAMIHAQSLGETFGLAIGEFSVHNKPIIAYGGNDVWNNHYQNILGNSGLWYETPQQLKNRILSVRRGMRAKDCYSTKYSPQIVMEQFAKYITQLT